MNNLTLNKKTVFNNKYDLLLIKFPIYLPIIYGLCLYMFPEYETELVFLTLLLLAEPHFGATWPFFINKKIIPLLIKKKLSYIWIIFSTNRFYFGLLLFN